MEVGQKNIGIALCEKRVFLRDIHMLLINTFHEKRGLINVFLSQEDNRIFVEPQGFISKALLQKFLKSLSVRDNGETNRHMHHIIDTSKVIFANPLNPFYLRAIKKIDSIGYYIVIVPNPFLRILVHLTKWINNPDVVCKSMEDCRAFLKENDTIISKQSPTI